MTVPTNRTIRWYRGKPDSCGSWRGWKKLPDCRKTPAKAGGSWRWACSIANPPRLVPTPTTGRGVSSST
jgi:hypothetical protein